MTLTTFMIALVSRDVGNLPDFRQADTVADARALVLCATSRADQQAQCRNGLGCHAT